jgi:hypothetical protein
MRSVERSNTGRKGKKRRTQGGDGHVDRKIQQNTKNDPLMGGSSASTSEGAGDQGDETNSASVSVVSVKEDRVFTAGDMKHGMGKVSTSSGNGR